MDRDPDGAGARGELHRVRDARVRPERDRRAEVAGLRVDPRDRAIVVRRPDRTLTYCDVDRGVMETSHSPNEADLGRKLRDGPAHGRPDALCVGSHSAAAPPRNVDLWHRNSSGFGTLLGIDAEELPRRIVPQLAEGPHRTLAERDSSVRARPDVLDGGRRSVDAQDLVGIRDPRRTRAGGDVERLVVLEPEP